MGLEAGTFISDLVTSNPVGATDPRSQGDDHLRLIKSVLQNTFPNADRAFRFEVAAAAKTANYTIVANDQRALITFDATSGNLTAAITAISNLFAGWLVTIMKVDSSANTVTVDPNSTETINGATTYVLSEQYEFVTLMVHASSFKIIGANGAAALLGLTADVIGAGTLGSDVYGSAVPVGAMMGWASATPPTGWLGVNGDTVGNAASGATQDSDDYENLFTHLWNSYADAQAPVSSGRGASAAADWAANKTITLPDYRGKVRLGAGAGTIKESVTAGNVSSANDTFTVVSNGDKWITGMKVQLTTSGTLPAGLSLATDYYIIRDSATLIRFATSLANALAGTDVDLTDAGSGTHTLTYTLTTRTVGDVGGEEAHADTVSEMPLHGHAYRQQTTTQNQAHANNSGPILTDNTGAQETHPAYTGTPSNTDGQSIGGTGGNSAHNNMPPWIADYTIIRY